METGDEIKLCSMFFANNRMLRFVKKALFSLVCHTKMSSGYGTGRSTNSLFLKTGQMCKVLASSDEYPHVEKIKNLREPNFKGDQRQTTSNWIVRILNEATSVVNI